MVVTHELWLNSSLVFKLTKVQNKSGSKAKKPNCPSPQPICFGRLNHGFLGPGGFDWKHPNYQSQILEKQPPHFPIFSIPPTPAAAALSSSSTATNLFKNYRNTAWLIPMRTISEQESRALLVSRSCSYLMTIMTLLAFTWAMIFITLLLLPLEILLKCSVLEIFTIFRKPKTILMSFYIVNPP